MRFGSCTPFGADPTRWIAVCVGREGPSATNADMETCSMRSTNIERRSNVGTLHFYRAVPAHSSHLEAKSAQGTSQDHRVEEVFDDYESASFSWCPRADDAGQLAFDAQ